MTRADQHGPPERRRQDRTDANRTDAHIKGGHSRSLLSCKYTSCSYRTIETCTTPTPSSTLIPSGNGTRSRQHTRGRSANRRTRPVRTLDHTGWPHHVHPHVRGHRRLRCRIQEPTSQIPIDTSRHHHDQHRGYPGAPTRNRQYRPSPKVGRVTVHESHEVRARLQPPLHGHNPSAQRNSGLPGPQGRQGPALGDAPPHLRAPRGHAPRRPTAPLGAGPKPRLHQIEGGSHCTESVGKWRKQETRHTCRIISKPVTRADQHGPPERRRQDRTDANRTDAHIKGGHSRSLLSCKYTSCSYRTIETCTTPTPSSTLIPSGNGTRSRQHTRGRFSPLLQQCWRTYVYDVQTEEGGGRKPPKSHSLKPQLILSPNLRHRRLDLLAHVVEGDHVVHGLDRAVNVLLQRIQQSHFGSRFA